jgi:periplasmic protein TonB
MSAPGAAAREEGPPAIADRSTVALKAESRPFLAGLACAAILHAALLIGAYRSQPRILGERDGQPDGISVDLVDAADFMSRTSARPTSPSKAMSPSRPEAQPWQPDAIRPADPQEATARAIEADNPNALELPGAPPKQRPAAPADVAKPKPQPQTQASAQPPRPLQLDVPESVFTSLGRSAAATRPPGVTRSGENDDFGRGVIRALRKTMPPPSGVLGRVMVRMFLNDNGNLQDVRVVSGSGDASLDQSVVFAVRQTSFPLPPLGATAADRTFLVTYIYR